MPLPRIRQHGHAPRVHDQMSKRGTPSGDLRGVSEPASDFTDDGVTASTEIFEFSAEGTTIWLYHVLRTFHHERVRLSQRGTLALTIVRRKGNAPLPVTGGAVGQCRT